MFNWDNYLDSLETKKIGIINVTNDSFSGDGTYVSREKLLSKFEIAKKRNIKLLDVGCMSTKPKFQAIDTNEESKRLDFFLQNISEYYDYSIDSFNPLVIRKAIKNGFLIINDVTGFKEDRLIKIAKEEKCGMIVMHKNPNSNYLHEKMHYKNIVEEVNSHLQRQIDNLVDKGINEKQIAIDPGFGFGKKMEDSAELFLGLENLIDTYPVIVGYSKKKFTELLKMTNNEMEEFCFKSGVSMLRLHIDN